MANVLLISWLIIFCYLVYKKHHKLFTPEIDNFLEIYNQKANDSYFLQAENEYFSMSQKIRQIDKYTISDDLYNELQYFLKELNDAYTVLFSIHTSVKAIHDCYMDAKNETEKKYWQENFIREITTYEEIIKKFEFCLYFLGVRYNEIYRL